MLLCRLPNPGEPCRVRVARVPADITPRRSCPGAAFKDFLLNEVNRMLCSYRAAIGDSKQGQHVTSWLVVPVIQSW